MSLPGWPHAASPFHAGEQAVQARAGTQRRMAETGRRVVRGVLPQQHRDFYPLLPFVVIAAVDHAGQPWATWLVGDAPGFVGSPDEAHLIVGALPPEGDPVRPLLRAGATLGLLGIELPTRRRNRANGRIVRRGETGFVLSVSQSFGNCAKYIQRRELLAAEPRGTGLPAQRLERLDARAAALVGDADTFFIASHAPGDGPSAGADISHRGGPAGFVHIGDDGRTLAWPDFAGNGFFNTLGNLAVEPRAGLVFVDLDNGDVLHVNGHAEIVWQGAEPGAMPDAERMLRLRIDELLYRPAALPLRCRKT